MHKAYPYTAKISLTSPRKYGTSTSLCATGHQLQGASPAVILYKEGKIQDIKRLCSQGTVILGVDKTYNLSNMHITARVVKQLLVVREPTDDHSLFIGPAFIHGHSQKNYSIRFLAS